MGSKLQLGKVSEYPQQYAPEILHPIPRADSRSTLGLTGKLPFRGVDIWNAWELSWLNERGQPQVATAELRMPAESAYIIESKSLKLYLSSFAMSRFESPDNVATTIGDDLAARIGIEVAIRLRGTRQTEGKRTRRMPGECLDEADVTCDAYRVDPSLLRVDPKDVAHEDLYSDLLRSLCPVTGQPDTGSVLISYVGPRIDRASLLQYIVSYRQHKEFHESCAERMFIDIAEHCRPAVLTVYARYERRGGIDINPFRSNFEEPPENLRLWRQ